MALDEFRAFLNSRGVALHDLGMDEKALARADALEAIPILRQAEIPILGGDVFREVGTEVQLAYANWSCNRESSEATPAFATRSAAKAETYIQSYPERLGERPLFLFVLAKK